MNNLILKVYFAVKSLRGEEGQDLIEYVLIGGVIGLGAIIGMKTFASDVNAAFTNLGTKLATYTS